MKKVIVVTGTPGTGKTTVAMRLAKKAEWKYVDVNTVISKHKLSEGYDMKKKCRVVDVKKLCRVLLKMAKDSEESVVIDSHLSHYLPSEKIDVCLVTKCNLKLLKQRLKRRKYGEAKVRENLDCEIFDVCYNEAIDAGHNVVAVATDTKVDYEKLIRKIKRLKRKEKK